MPKCTIWHNPRCTKSRQTLALLEEKGCDVTIREYLKDVPSTNDLKDALKKLKMTPRDLMRKKEDPYKKLKLADESKSESVLIQAMTENPALIERPVVFCNSKAAIGRPPENVNAIL